MESELWAKLTFYPLASDWEVKSDHMVWPSYWTLKHTLTKYYTSFSTPILNLDFSELRSCSNDNFVHNGLVGIFKYTYRKSSYQKLCSYKNYINSIAFVFGSWDSLKEPFSLSITWMKSNKNTRSKKSKLVLFC